MADMARKGRNIHDNHPRGEDHGCAKLRLKDVLNIRKSEKTNVELGKRYGLTSAAIYNVRHRKTWAHV